MADTHINAFFADVDEKQKALERAAGELQAAKVRLEAKKKEVGFVDPVVEKDTTPEPKQETRQDKKK